MDLPLPERPTIAMFLPAGTVSETECSTPPFSLVYSKLTSRNSSAPPRRAELAAAGEILGRLVEHFEHAGARREALLQRRESVTRRRIGAVISSSAVRNDQKMSTVMVPAATWRSAIHNTPPSASEAMNCTTGLLVARRRDELHVAAAVVFVDRSRNPRASCSCALNTLMTRWPSSASLTTRVTSPIDAWMRAL